VYWARVQPWPQRYDIHPPQPSAPGSIQVLLEVRITGSVPLPHLWSCPIDHGFECSRFESSLFHLDHDSAGVSAPLSMTPVLS